MSKQRLSLQGLSDALTHGHLVLVPNNRLRNSLLSVYGQQQTQQVWAQPRIYTLDQWIAEKWALLQEVGYSPACINLVDKWQRLWWWESIIQTSPKSQHLANVKSLAQLADTSYQNLERWCLVEKFLAEIYLDDSANAAQFQQWILAFNQKLLATQSISFEQSLAIIEQALVTGVISKETVIYLEGFDEIYPLAHSLLNAATDHIEKQPPQQAEQSLVVKTSAVNFEAEIKAAAAWAAQCLRTNTNDAYIGIVVPNLGQCRQMVERIFVAEFESILLDPSVPRYTLPFNFSAGVPLGKQPIIEDLLLGLSFGRRMIPSEDVLAFLNSSFWGDGEKEALLRAFATQKIQDLAKRELSLGEVIEVVSKLENAESLGEHLKEQQISIVKRLELLAQWFRNASAKKTPGEWLIKLDQFFSALNWPGARALDSIEYQQLQSWLRIREELFCSAHYLPAISFSDFLRILKERLDTTPFQAQTPQSPIQILGALEAAGLRFSHLWVLGLNDTQWPAIPSPSSLMPLDFQRTHNMPRASATREYEIAKQLTDRYLGCAENLVLSYSHSEGDNELRESALIRHLPESPLDSILANATEMNGLDRLYKQLLMQDSLEWVSDSKGPQLLSDEKVRGGSQLFKLQAACPFEAFVRLRLGAQSPDEAVMGFSPADRGNILHEALARFWRIVSDSANLQNKSDNEISDIVRDIASQVVNQHQRKNPQGLSATYCGLEVDRLVELLSAWLADEKLRSPFKVVAIEQAQTIQFAGLPLKLRVDRIDELNSGLSSPHRLVIDYKTGNATRKSWQIDRFTEPQLPLYSIVSDDVSGICFAVINRKRMAWDGLAGEGFGPFGLDGIGTHEDWGKQLLDWRTRLDELAQAFIAGEAKVEYMDAKAMEYSQDLLPLNRLLDKSNIELFKEANSK